MSDVPWGREPVMTKPKPCPPAPGPLEGYAARFDDLFSHLAQRRGFREYLAGLLAPRERNKTLTALAGAEPVVGARKPEVQRLQFFLSESCWDPDRVNARRLQVLLDDPVTAPHGGGVLVIDDSGDRKDGTATAHVGRQWLGRLGKTDSGIVTVSTVWADERVYYPLHAVPYTPARWFPGGKNDPGFATKPQIAAGLAARARQGGVVFRVVVADCFLRRQRRVPPPAAHHGPAVCGGAQTPQRHLGALGPAAHPGGGRPCPGLGRPRRARGLDPGAARFPRWAHRDLVGR
jgi:DDE superfamily endonuclease